MSGEERIPRESSTRDQFKVNSSIKDSRGFRGRIEFTMISLSIDQFRGLRNKSRDSLFRPKLLMAPIPLYESVDSHPHTHSSTPFCGPDVSSQPEDRNAEDYTTNVATRSQG